MGVRRTGGFSFAALRRSAPKPKTYRLVSWGEKATVRRPYGEAAAPAACGHGGGGGARTPSVPRFDAGLGGVLSFTRSGPAARREKTSHGSASDDRPRDQSGFAAVDRGGTKKKKSRGGRRGAAARTSMGAKKLVARGAPTEAVSRHGGRHNQRKNPHEGVGTISGPKLRRNRGA